MADGCIMYNNNSGLIYLTYPLWTNGSNRHCAMELYSCSLLRYAMIVDMKPETKLMASKIPA